jgi:hypothetical protein
MRRRQKRSPVVTDKEGKRLFIHLSHSGIHPLVVLCDGLTLVYFGKKDGPYLDVRTVLDWHEKELRDSHGQSGSREMADTCRTILSRFEAGEMEINED